MGSSAPPCHTLAWGQIVPLKHIRLRQHGTLRLCSVFPRSARKNRTPIGLTQLLHPASQSDIFACGSMVRSDHLFVVFCARRAQKTTNEEMASTALPQAQTANCVSPNQQKSRTALPQAKTADCASRVNEWKQALATADQGCSSIVCRRLSK